MSKAERDDDEEYFHECDQCGESEQCTAPEWQACEGKGDVWYCSEDCAEAAEAERNEEREDTYDSEDARINEDDWGVDR